MIGDNLENKNFIVTTIQLPIFPTTHLYKFKQMTGPPIYSKYPYYWRPENTQK